MVFVPRTLPAGLAGPNRRPLHAIAPDFLRASTRSLSDAASGMMRATGWPWSVTTMVRPALTWRTHSLSVDLSSLMPMRFSRVLIETTFYQMWSLSATRKTLTMGNHPAFAWVYVQASLPDAKIGQLTLENVFLAVYCCRAIHYTVARPASSAPCERRAERIMSGYVNREAVHPAYRL